MQHSPFAALCRELSGGPLRTDQAPRTHGDVYQFGVARGRSLAKLVPIFHAAPVHFWAFDTFSGMPHETEGHPTLSIWSPGHFSAGGPNATLALDRAVGGAVRWIVGDYKNSLTPTLAAERGMRPAMYVDVDCDLFRSSALALEWIFASGIAGVGTVIGYDDWWDLACATKANATSEARHPLHSGEGLAHAEVARTHGVRFRCLCGPCASMPLRQLHAASSWRAYFVVEAIGAAEPSDGLRLTAAEIASFLRHNQRCVSVGRRWVAHPARRVFG